MSRRKRVLVAALGVTLALGACTSKHAAKPKQEKRTLRVAVLFTTTGRSGDLAQAVLGSAALAKSAAEQRGVTLELVQEDYAGDLKKVPKLVADAKSKADALVVGTEDPGVEESVRTVEDLPVLYPLSTGDSLLAGTTNAFRFGPSNKMQVDVLVRFLLEHRGYKRIGVLAENSPFGKEGIADVDSALADAGVTPILDETFTPGRDVHTPVAHAGQLDADALIVWTASESEASRIVVEEQKMGFAYQLALPGNIANATFAKNATAQVTPVAFRDGILSVGPWAGPWFRLRRIISFYEDFQSQNSALAPVPAASVYDAVLAAVQAAADRGTTPSDLIGGIQALRDFAGAGVPVTFTPDRHEGLDPDDLAVYGFTKNQDAAGGDFMPDVDTGGGFFTIVNASLHLPPNLRFLARGLAASPSPSSSSSSEGSP